MLDGGREHLETLPIKAKGTEKTTTRLSEEKKRSKARAGAGRIVAKGRESR